MKIKMTGKEDRQVARALMDQRHVLSAGSGYKIRGTKHLRGIRERRQDSHEHRF